MISHKHKTIFIHIPKCAGSSIETAFGIDVNNNIIDREHLFGWDDENKLYLQHATPQELIDNKFISKEQWTDYYKFIVIRNTWDKAMSDFFWFKETKKFLGSFDDYINKKHDFLKFLQKGKESYRGDHLTPQKEYMFLDGKPILYNKIIYFDKSNLDDKLEELTKDIDLPRNFFKIKVQVGKKFKNHYSKFYTNKNKELVYMNFQDDIEFFNFKFDDKRSQLDHLKLLFGKIL